MWILLFVSHSNERQWGGGGTGVKVKTETDDLRFGTTNHNTSCNQFPFRGITKDWLLHTMETHLILSWLSIFTFKCFYPPTLLPQSKST